MTEQALEHRAQPRDARPRGPAAERSRRSSSRRRATSRATRGSCSGCSAARSAASRTSWSSTTRRTTRTGSGRRDETSRRRRRVARRGASRRTRPRVHGLGRRPRPHPQASRHQLLRRPLGDAVLPRARRRGHEPDLSVGRQRLRADRRHRVRTREDSAARTLRPDRGGASRVLQHLALDHEQADRRRARREASQPEAGSGPAVGGAPDPTARARPGRRSGERWAEGDETAPASLHPRLQEHEARGVDLRVAGRRQGAGRHPAGDIAELRNSDGKRCHHPCRLEGRRETDAEGAKNDESRWMRFTLDTVGKRDWPRDDQGRPIYPEGFEDWRRSSTGRCTRRAATCDASSASACSPRAGTATP